MIVCICKDPNTLKTKNKKIFKPNEFYGKGCYGDLDYAAIEDYIWKNIGEGLFVGIMDTENLILDKELI